MAARNIPAHVTSNLRKAKNQMPMDRSVASAMTAGGMNQNFFICSRSWGRKSVTKTTAKNAMLQLPSSRRTLLKSRENRQAIPARAKPTGRKMSLRFVRRAKARTA